MMFFSIDFLFFLLVFFFLYHAVLNKSADSQNGLLLFGSAFFYAYWDWRFLLLLLGITGLIYGIALLIKKSISTRTKRLFYFIGLFGLLGTLVLFKYADFFISTLALLFSRVGIPGNSNFLRIVLPLGISFYTFRLLSYLIDVKNEKIEAIQNWVTFFVYVMFFPTLVSGPIDKARDFVPQLERKREFNYPETINGLRQILWGVFKKAVIADNCARIVDPIFDQFHTQSSGHLLLCAFLYTIQIYTDFSGYSDMAIGLSRLLGFRVSRNFAYPFFAQNIAEFWRKWHISLTNWVTEYVFTPLVIAFRNLGKWGIVFAVLINFFVIGLWHGANWTFVFFGLLHGCYFIPLIIRGKLNPKKKNVSGNNTFPAQEWLNRLSTFILVLVGFILFRSETVPVFFQYIKLIFSENIFTGLSQLYTLRIGITLVSIIGLFVVEWRTRNTEFALETIGLKWPRVVRLGFYYLILVSIYLFSVEGKAFIYFQF